MSAVFEAVEDVFSSVGDAVGDVADAVVSTASDVLETVAQNPLLVIAAIAAPQLLPVLGEAAAGAEFGFEFGFGDIAGELAGEEFGSEFVFDIADPEIFGDLAGEVSGAQLAADPSYVNPSYSGSAPVSVIDNFVQNLPQTAVENLAKSAAGNVVKSAVTGQDLDLKSVITGAALMTAGGGITASLRDMGIPTSVAPILTSAGVAAVTGGDPVMAALSTGINQGWQTVGADGIRALKDYIKPENYETLKTMAEAEGVDMSAPPQVAQAEPTTPTTPETPAASPLAQAETTTPTTPETPAVSPLQQVASAETKTDVPVEELKYGEEGYVYPDGTVQGPTGTIEIPEQVAAPDAGLASPLSPEVTPTQQDIINASNQAEAQQMGPSLPTGGVVDTSDVGLASPLSPQVTPTQQDIIDVSNQLEAQQMGPQLPAGGVVDTSDAGLASPLSPTVDSSFTQASEQPVPVAEVSSPLSPPSFEPDPNSYLTPQQQEDVSYLVNTGVPVQEAVDLVVNDAITVTPEPEYVPNVTNPLEGVIPPYTPNVTDPLEGVIPPYQTNVTDPLEGVVTPQMPPAVTPETPISLPSISIPQSTIDRQVINLLGSAGLGKGTTNPTADLNNAMNQLNQQSKYDDPSKRPFLSPTFLTTGSPLQSMPLFAGLDPKLVNILANRGYASGGSVEDPSKREFLKASGLSTGAAANADPMYTGLDPELVNVLRMRGYASGGELVAGPENRLYAKHDERGFAVGGPGTGQSDDIPTMLSDGEYVIDADTVAALGDGSSKAGAQALDKMRMAIRKHKRSAPADKIPPKAKSPLEYLNMGRKKHG